jgi:predicted permease
MLASLPSDLYFALRQLRKSPGFAFTAILTLALGIGTTTAIYSLIDGVLLKPLPLPHPEQLVAAYTEETRPGQTPDHIPTSYRNYLDWRDRNRTFTQLAAYAGDARLVSRTNGMEGAVLPICRITANYFDALGVQPILGRNFTPADDQPGHHVVILSYGLWERLLASDRNVLGTTILVSDQPFTIVGVMPKGFTEPRGDNQADLWTSFAPFLDGSAPRGKERDNGFAEVIGRLKPGSTQRQALADLATIQSSLAKSYPEDRYLTSAFVQSKLVDITGDMRPALFLLMASVLAVLLIVCTNVAGLMLTRTMKRRGEIALRTALGASSRRVWQQLLIESLVLAIAGGAIGIALAYALLHTALPFVPDDIPRIGEVAIDGRVLAFTAAISVLCAILSSLVPARRLSRVSPIEPCASKATAPPAGAPTASRTRSSSRRPPSALPCCSPPDSSSAAFSTCATPKPAFNPTTCCASCSRSRMPAILTRRRSSSTRNICRSSPPSPASATPPADTPRPWKAPTPARR